MQIMTLPVRPHDALLLAETSTRREADSPGEDTCTAEQQRLRLHAATAELRDSLRDLEVLIKLRDRRTQALRQLSNPCPPWGSIPRRVDSSPLDALQILPEANAAIVPHDAFRQRINWCLSRHDDLICRKVLRTQLLRCETPKHILRVVAVAMQHPYIARQLALLHEAITRALFRARNEATDRDILRTISQILWRFRLAEIHVTHRLILLAVKFAARARSLDAMRKLLSLYRQRGLPMANHVFRAIIAKFSIGRRGLGEIRNGRWRRSELLQVLTGFESEAHLPPDKRCHLGTFLLRSDWHFLHGWIAVLARCKASDAIWDEWELWRVSEPRLRPKALAIWSDNINTKLRGEYWFVEQMTMSGDLEKAWRIFEETEMPLSALAAPLRGELIEGVQFASRWTDEIRVALLEKYDAQLANIESAFGVRWEPGMVDGEGQHVLFKDQEEALDALGADDWTPEDDYGFPYDDGNLPIVPRDEHYLHVAKEKGPIKNPGDLTHDE